MVLRKLENTRYKYKKKEFSKPYESGGKPTPPPPGASTFNGDKINLNLNLNLHKTNLHNHNPYDTFAYFMLPRKTHSERARGLDGNTKERRGEEARVMPQQGWSVK